MVYCVKIEQLKDFLLQMPVAKRRVFAKECGTTLGQLTQIYCGNRSCNPTLAIEIDKHSKGAVKCDVLCPNTDFNYLRQQKTASSH